MEILQAIEWDWTDRGVELLHRLARLERAALRSTKKRAAKLRREYWRVAGRYAERWSLFRITRVRYSTTVEVA